MERSVQLVLGLALLVVFVQSRAAETDDLSELTSQPDGPADQHDADLALNHDDFLLGKPPPADLIQKFLRSRKDGPADELLADDAVDDNVQVLHFTTSYKYRLTPAATWEGARKYCKNWGGDLATYGMRNMARRSKIMKILKAKGNPFWIGLNELQTKGCFRWVDETCGGCCAKKATIHWAKGEPNNLKSNEKCVELVGTKGWKSNDHPCSYKRRGVCEIRIHSHHMYEDEL